ncbi:histidine kinase [Sandarakinorhabdus sp.]|uniref:histidine kinase n=1 Tax=Sandarakinorhabdus sp. TaxID=1916663 RepID=UPI00286D8A72|nr:histidine kinase [Sandarakinorhabdus sp.]
MRRILAFALSLASLLFAGLLLYRAPPVTSAAAALVVPGGNASGRPASGPAPLAEAPRSPLTDADRAARRLVRYDTDASGVVSREEYLVNRRKAWAKADSNRDGRLDFEEYAAATTAKFAKADRNADQRLSPAEFAATAPRRKAAPACACPAPAET